MTEQTNTHLLWLDKQPQEAPYTCVCCQTGFWKGRRYSKDNDLLFCPECVEGERDVRFLRSLGLTLCQIYNVTINECEIIG